MRISGTLLRSCLIAWLSVAGIYAQQCTRSVLSNINCGGGAATCHQFHVGYTGAVRCTCTATCSSPSSITGTVGASRQVQWGQNAPCSSALTGRAYGDTTGTVRNPTVASGVYVEVSLQGNFAGGPYQSSAQQVDCFLGTIVDDAPVIGLC